MKKLIILVLILGLLPVSNVFSQTSKGSILFGAASQFSFLPFEEGSPMSGLFGISFSTIKFDNEYLEGVKYKINSFNLSPKLGYFLVDNLALGVDVNFATMTLKTSYEANEDKVSHSLTGFGPFIRYYFPSEKILPFIEAGGVIGQLKIKSEEDSDLSDEEKTSLSGFYAGGGIGISLSNKAVLDMSLNYQSINLKEKVENDSGDKTTIGTFGLRVGIVVYIGKD